MDTSDDNLLVHGVVSPEKSHAVFAVAVVGSLDASPGPRIRLRGLSPDRSYRLRPVIVGSAPSGLRPPYWWGVPPYRGAVFSGAALAHVGVAAPMVHPDQVVLLRADATDAVDGNE
jgi:alpha-galactosidase